MRRVTALVLAMTLVRASYAQAVADSMANPVGFWGLKAMCTSADAHDLADAAVRYQAMLSQYWELLETQGLPALGSIAVAEQSPLLLQPSDAHARARARVAKVERELAQIEETMVRDFSDAHSISSVVTEDYIRRLRCNRVRAHLRSRIGSLNPAVVWDIEDAVETMGLTAECRRALVPELTNYRSRLLGALMDVDSAASAMYVTVARRLESEGFATSDLGMLSDPSHDISNFRRVVVGAWREALRVVLSSARVVERIQWEYAARVEAQLPLRSRLAFRGGLFQAMLNPIDDGDLERRLAVAMSTACSAELDQVALELLQHKAEFMTYAARELEAARMERSVFTDAGTAADEGAVRWVTRFRTVSDETVNRLRVLGVVINGSGRPAGMHPNWHSQEVPTESQMSMERRWQAPKLDVAIRLDVRAHDGEGEADSAWYGLEGSNLWKRADTASSADWKRIMDVIAATSPDADYVAAVEAVDRFCGVETTALIQMLELIRSPPVGVVGSNADAACMWFCTIGCGAASVNPYAIAGGEWMVCVAKVRAAERFQDSDPEAWIKTYFEVMLPLHVQRMSAWMQWRRTALVGAVLSAVAERTRKQTGSDLMKEVEDSLASSVEATALSLRNLRLAHSAIVKENRKWFEELVARNPERTDELRSAYLREVGIVRGSFAGALEPAPERSGLDPDSPHPPPNASFDIVRRSFVANNWLELELCRQRLDAPDLAEARAGGLVGMDQYKEAMVRSSRTQSWIEFVRTQAWAPAM